MNFLGHSRFSIEMDLKTLYGNFVGDFYKGRVENLELPYEVKNGLKLHRKIDSVSDDNNILVKEIDYKFNLFRGVISDIFIDHFLALDWLELFGEKLEIDIKKIYSEIDYYKDIHTENFKEVYSWIKKENILSSYKDKESVRRTFYGISKRVRSGEILNQAYDELIKKYDNYHELSIEEFKRVNLLIKSEYVK
ncbi:MAG: DUF479 domain-containing protein [Sebaldella sp.]|nr:DUF479 domain-containing protein [Sebaldella sp.]